jgi:Family of unknown function (DUF6922)
VAVKLAPNGLPQSADWLFPEYEFGSLEPEEYADTIMERILERGTRAEVNWLFDHYGEHRVQDWVRRRGLRALSRRSFALWRLILGVTQPNAPAWAKSDGAWPY